MLISNMVITEEERHRTQQLEAKIFLARYPNNTVKDLDPQQKLKTVELLKELETTDLKAARWLAEQSLPLLQTLGRDGYMLILDHLDQKHQARKIELSTQDFHKIFGIEWDDRLNLVPKEYWKKMPRLLKDVSYDGLYQALEDAHKRDEAYVPRIINTFLQLKDTDRVTKEALLHYTPDLVEQLNASSYQRLANLVQKFRGKDAYVREELIRKAGKAIHDLGMDAYETVALSIDEICQNIRTRRHKRGPKTSELGRYLITHLDKAASYGTDAYTILMHLAKQMHKQYADDFISQTIRILDTTRPEHLTHLIKALDTICSQDWNLTYQATQKIHQMEDALAKTAQPSSDICLLELITDMKSASTVSKIIDLKKYGKEYTEKVGKFY
jgi:hypothetical protein